MLIKTQAIVLRTHKYGESQLIIDLLTKSMGCVTFIQHVQQSTKKRIGIPFFQPLTLLEIEYDHRRNSQLQHFKDISVAYPFKTLPFDPYKVSIALFSAEFLYNCVRREPSDEALFDFILNSVRWLDMSSGSCSNFHLVLMLHLSRFIGFYPNLDDYRQDDFFDLRNGVFCPIPPSHSEYIVPEEASKIRLLMRMTYESMGLFHFSRHERNRCVRLIIDYYRLHIPSFPEMNSLSVLETLFQ